MNKPLFFCLTLITLPFAAFSDEESSPSEYTKVTSNKKYIFVMLRPLERRGETGLYKKYPKSGLYLNNRSTKPLWTVDWYAFDVKVSADGQYLIRYGPWPRSRE